MLVEAGHLDHVVPLDEAGIAGHAQTTLEERRALFADWRQDWIDEDTDLERGAPALAPLVRCQARHELLPVLEHDDAAWNVDLRRGEPDTGRAAHRRDHRGEESLELGRLNRLRRDL